MRPATIRRSGSGSCNWPPISRRPRPARRLRMGSAAIRRRSSGGSRARDWGMSWILNKGRYHYFQTARKLGGRVVTTHHGRGEIALAAERREQAARQERERLHREKTERDREELARL